MTEHRAEWVQNLGWVFTGKAFVELMTCDEHRKIVKELKDQCSYWREVALCSTAEVKSSTYDD